MAKLYNLYINRLNNTGNNYAILGKYEEAEIMFE